MVSLIAFLMSFVQVHKTYGLSFRPMDEVSYEEFITLAQAEYLKQLNESGIQADAQAVTQEFDVLLPQGYATANNYFYDALDLISGKCIAKVWWYTKESKDKEVLPNAEIGLLWILPEFRGRGWGKQVLIDLEKLYFKDTVSYVKLHVFRHNTAAINLYKHVGYETYITTDYGYFMEKWLIDRA